MDESGALSDSGSAQRMLAAEETARRGGSAVLRPGSMVGWAWGMGFFGCFLRDFSIAILNHQRVDTKVKVLGIYRSMTCIEMY